MDDFPSSELLEESPEESEEETLEKSKDKEIDFKEILNNPIAQSLLGGCKDLFKKEKSDPDVCEITIKAPSEVVLKLFKVFEAK